METGKFLELRKEVLAEIKESEAKKNHGRSIDSGSDSDDMADPMEQVIPKCNFIQWIVLISWFYWNCSVPKKKIWWKKRWFLHAW